MNSPWCPVSVPTVVPQQLCNTCSAQSTVATAELCLCRAGGERVSARSVQQISECSDGTGLDIGSQLERVNTHCVTGFPDVHFSFLVNGLDGQLDSAINNPEMNETETCSQASDLTRARVTDYVADIFTTEDHLMDAVTMLGATATNIAVTANLVFYGGGLYYNPEECVDYVDEPVPAECQEERGGRLSYTCLTVNNVDCAQMMPRHCDIFFKQSDTSFPHSLTVVGLGEVRRNRKRGENLSDILFLTTRMRMGQSTGD